jgi:hypothetical protein
MHIKSLIFFTIACISLSCGQLSVNAEDNPTAADTQKAFKKGTMAAEQGSWDVALKYFNEVLQADQFYFPAYFNMGLAHARAGNELAAIAWFKAYLHYVPDAPDRAQVEDEIARLEVALETKMGKIVAQAEEAALALPEKGANEYSSPRQDGVNSVFYNLGRIGDMALAEKYVARHYPNETYAQMNKVKQDYAVALAEAGDCEAALKIAGSLSGEDKDRALDAVVEMMYKKDDLAGLVKVIMEINDTDIYIETMKYILEDLGQAGRADDAVAVYGKIKENLLTRFDALPTLAAVMAEAGRQKEASELIKKEEALVGDIENIRFPRLMRVAQAYAAAADTANARRMTDSIEAVLRGEQKDIVWKYLALLEYQLGNEEKSREYAGKVDADDCKELLLLDMFSDARKKKDLPELEKMLPQLACATSYLRSEVTEQYAYVAWQYFKKGGTAGFERVEKAHQSRQEKDELRPEDFYCALTISALTEGNKDAAAGFFAKLENSLYERGKVLAFRVGQEFTAKRPAAVLEILMAQRARWDQMFFDTWFQNGALRAVKEVQQAGDGKTARAFVDTAAHFAQEKKAERIFGNIADLYDAVGDKKLAAEFRARRRDSSWIELARSFEKGDTANPAAYFEKNKNKEPKDMPFTIVWLAVEYADGLRKIGIKEKE